jgi:hypothetical protein
LPLRERRTFLLAVALLPLLALGLRLVGFARLVAWLERRTGAPEQLPNPDPIAVRLSRTRYLARRAAEHGPYRGNCLSQSLTLWLLLRRQRIPADLRIGVRKENGLLLAHAWVEFQGQPLNASFTVCERYARFEQPILPRSAQWS